LQSFYNAPLTRFWVDFIGYLTLVILFGFALLTPFKDYISAVEFTLLAWFIGLAAEEFRQLSAAKLSYFRSGWNQLDVVILIFFFIGVAVRGSNAASLQRQLDAKVIFSINVIPLVCRISRFYATSSTLGPKVCAFF
jgi:hypothetical protein